LIDRAGLGSVENENGTPEFLNCFKVMACALLVETIGESKSALNRNIDIIKNTIKSIPVEGTASLLIFRKNTRFSGK